MTTTANADAFVVIPMTCGYCDGPIEAHVERARGFGYSSFYQVPCPHCQKENVRHLPGRLLDVQIPGPKLERPGDCVIVEKDDRTCDVYRVSPSGKRDLLRARIDERGRAYQIARSELESGGRVWIAGADTPNEVERY